MECVLGWIKNYKVPWLDPMSIDPGPDRHCGPVSLDRPNEIYSVPLKMWFRSLFEKNVADALHKSKIKFQYESFGFSWRTKVYTPDFYLPEYASFLEVKGKWQASQRSKYADFREVWPEIRLLVIPWTVGEQLMDNGEVGR
jgi:hypothetical protein